MAEHFRGQPVVLRFIEYMDVGSTNGWRLDEVVPASEILAPIDRALAARAARAEPRGRGRPRAGATATAPARSA